MKKTLLLFLIFTLACGTALSFYAYTRTKASTNTMDEPVNFLVLGSDQASGNTDVMILVGYRPKEKTVTLMQIPRDTYYGGGSDPMKINHLCNVAKENGKNEKSAISFAADVISEVFSVPIHGVIEISLDALAKFVDAIGGIPMNVPISMQYRDEEQGLLIDLPAGERTLTGKEAVQFVRFRSDYLLGDIGRLDAQKQFLAALYRKLTETPSAIPVAFSFLQDDSCTLSIQDSVRIPMLFSRVCTDWKSITLSFLSMPGEATLSEGIWYYTPNKQALSAVLNKSFSGEYLPLDSVDPNGYLCKKSDPAMASIYLAKDHPYKVYTQDDVNDIIIAKKE